MKNSARGELVEPCELSVSAVNTPYSNIAAFQFSINLNRGALV